MKLSEISERKIQTHKPLSVQMQYCGLILQINAHVKSISKIRFKNRKQKETRPQSLLCSFSYFEILSLSAYKNCISLILIILLLITKLLLLMFEKEIFLSLCESVLGRLPLDLSL